MVCRFHLVGNAQSGRSCDGLPKKARVFKAADGGVRDLFKDRHRFMSASSMPKVGDLVVFKHSHIGIVENVQGNTIFTVEGNASNRVRRRSYSRSNSDIDGYCHPAYELVEDDMTKDELLDALESDRGQKALRKAVTGTSCASRPARTTPRSPPATGSDEVRAKIREIRRAGALTGSWVLA